MTGFVTDNNGHMTNTVTDNNCHMTEFVSDNNGHMTISVTDNNGHMTEFVNSQSEIVMQNSQVLTCSPKVTQSTNILSTSQSEIEMTTKIEVSKEMFEELTNRVAKLEEAMSKSRGTASTREMTDDDARRVLNGDLKEVAHKAAAETLGLSYGQVYSCRGEYTFKHILKALKAEGFKNPWVK